MSALMNSPYEDRRDAERQALRPTVEVRGPHFKCDAVMLDISTGGARLEGSFLPQVGNEVALRCCGINADARVVWKRGARIGVEFATRLSDHDLACIMASAVTADRSETPPLGEGHSPA